MTTENEGTALAPVELASPATPPPAVWDKTVAEKKLTAASYRRNGVKKRIFRVSDFEVAVAENLADEKMQEWADLLVTEGLAQKQAARLAKLIFIHEVAVDARAAESVHAPGQVAPPQDSLLPSGDFQPPAHFPDVRTAPDAVLMFVHTIERITKPDGCITIDDMKFGFSVYLYMVNHESAVHLKPEEIARLGGRSLPYFFERAQRWSKAFGVPIPAGRGAEVAVKISEGMRRKHQTRIKTAKPAARPRKGLPPGRPKKWTIDRLPEVMAGESLRRKGVVAKLTRIGIPVRSAERLVSKGISSGLIRREGLILSMAAEPAAVPAGSEKIGIDEVKPIVPLV